MWLDSKAVNCPQKWGNFKVTSKQTLESIFQQIQDELRHQYSIGYPPPSEAHGFRSISLTTRTSGLKVQCRSGYYRYGR